MRPRKGRIYAAAAAAEGSGPACLCQCLFPLFPHTQTRHVSSQIIIVVIVSDHFVLIAGLYVGTALHDHSSVFRHHWPFAVSQYIFHPDIISWWRLYSTNSSPLACLSWLHYCIFICTSIILHYHYLNICTIIILKIDTTTFTALLNIIAITT